MPRPVSLAHSQSIIDRQRHVMSIGLENLGLFHYDINVNDVFNRRRNQAHPFSEDKWEITGACCQQGDGSLVATGPSVLLISKDYVEIDPDQRYFLAISLLNMDLDASHTISVGTINYTDLSTKITTGRPTGTDYDNWCLYNYTLPANHNWNDFSNTAISIYDVKTGESSDPGDLHRWPVGAKYGRLFIKIDSLGSNRIALNNISLTFLNDDDVSISLTPEVFLVDRQSGRFGGSAQLAPLTTNLLWNGDLKFGNADWSIGTTGSGLVTSSVESDDSYKIYFEDVRDVKNVIQIDMPQSIEADKYYTLTFYARASQPTGFRRISVVNPSTEAIGWSAEEIIYLTNIWQKFIISTDSLSSVPSPCSRLIIAEPDLLEEESLLVYYNGVYLQRGEDYYEIDDTTLHFNFTPADEDIINIFTKMTSDFGSTTNRITFHTAAESGDVVQIRHFVDTGDLDSAIGVASVYQISLPTSTVLTGNYTADTPNKLSVYRNGLLLEEDHDYTTAVDGGVIRLNFAYTLATDDLIKTVFWVADIARYNSIATSGQTEFDLPTGETYTDDGKHLLVYNNGVLLTEGVLDDYVETDSNTITLNSEAGWEDISSAYPYANDILCLAHDGSSVWVAGDSGGRLVRSTDNSQSWSNVASSPFVGYGVPTEGIDSDESSVWVAVSGLVFGKSSFGYAARSTDNGATWSDITGSLPSTSYQLYDVATNNSSLWYVVGVRIYVSLDNGATWFSTTKSIPLLSAQQYNAVETDDNGVWLIAGQQGFTPVPALQRSGDDGSSWSNISASHPGSDPLTALATDKNGVWITGDSTGNLARSTDHGVTWSNVAGYPGSATVYDIATDGNGTWYAGETSGNIYKSTDNGVSWALDSSYPNSNDIRSIDVNGDVWIVGGNSGDLARYVSGEDITGSRIALVVLDAPYEFSIDEWQLSSSKSIFTFTEENSDVLRLVSNNGVVLARDAGGVDYDYEENAISVSEGFYYERHDAPAALAGQTEFTLPFTYTPGNDELWVYRNGVLLTHSKGTNIEDYLEVSSSKIELTVSAAAGELITVFKITEIVGTGSSVVEYTYENYATTEDIDIYKVAQDYVVGDDSLQVFLNGLLLRSSTDYTEVDTNTIELLIDHDNGDSLTFLVATFGPPVSAVYMRDVYYGSEVSTGNDLITANNLNYAESVTGSVWFKEVKLEEGMPAKEAYAGGIMHVSNILYDMPFQENEGTVAYFITPYDYDLANEINYQGEVDNFAALPGGASVDDVYRTKDTYEYYQWDGSDWNFTRGPTAIALTDNSGLTGDHDQWRILKIERIIGQSDQFRAVFGEPNNYVVQTLPAGCVCTHTAFTWSLFGTQFFQVEVPSYSDLPTLTASEQGYVYRVADTGYYYFWDGTQWLHKAPTGYPVGTGDPDTSPFAAYTDLPTLTADYDGFVAYVDEEPELYKGELANLSAIETTVSGYTADQNGWVWKATDTGNYYIWDWDYVANNGALRKIIPGYYYQWIWDFGSQSGTWEQSNKVKIYRNGGQEGVYTKSYHGIGTVPSKFLATTNMYAKFDEMRLDSIARDAREIAAWVKSDAPFFPRGQKAIMLFKD